MLENFHQFFTSVSRPLDLRQVFDRIRLWGSDKQMFPNSKYDTYSLTEKLNSVLTP